MPIYEYVCARCARRTEVIQGMNDPPPRVCPHCGGKLKKAASAPAFHLKGSGWYKTDYASPAGKAMGSEKSESSEKSDKTEKAGASEKVEKSEKGEKKEKKPKKASD
ncbi:MAG TPA: FmdB family zinc ribbon protein [Thermoanaerobaculia bacterium]|jgi:putative FmdB family regulatory protein